MDYTYYTIGKASGPLCHFSNPLARGYYHEDYNRAREQLTSFQKDPRLKDVDRIFQVFVEVTENQYEWHPFKETE